jgi:hypothetical protein
MTRRRLIAALAGLLAAVAVGGVVPQPAAAIPM